MTEKQTAHAPANRLAREASPYLLQHAHNPVDWYPWGAEAFEKARVEDRPIFLSIGYSTCHWCHVMERESFEDRGTAEILNAHFVAVKVDREERPDVDATYMKAVQMLTGSGGWPLSVFLTPEGKPFYGGTYFPPRSMYGRPSFTQVLEAIAEAWRADRSKLLESSERITAALGQTPRTADSGEPSLDFLKAGYEALASDFDEAFGGFGGAPKFPQPTTLMLLLTYWYRTGESRALRMVEKTLDAMARGGIHDHLGGGFHRYSTDAKWLVPHFEKMLYDQALLSKVYVQAYQITGRDDHADVARDVLDYVLRDMTDPQGGFYAAEDADSGGEEGTFYVWKRDEIEKILGADEAPVFCAYYGVTKGGNFEGKTNVLEIVTSIEELARRYERPRGRIERDLARAIEQLYERRSTRPRPHKDDKVITAWNGLMISSMARGGAVLGESRYVRAAEKAAECVLGSLRLGNRLMRYYRAGQAREKAFLDDYAFMVQGLMDLYEATFDARWLREAQVLAGQMIDLFGDKEGGGFYMTGRDAEQLISRDKPSYDGAVPSGNSIAALTLLKLGRVLMNQRFTDVGERALHWFSAVMSAAPTSLTAMLRALDYNAGPTQEIVIAAGEADRDGQTLAREVRRHFLPRATTLVRFSGDRGRALAETVPFTEALAPIDGATAAYVCENYACRQPVTTAEALRRILVDFSGRD